MERQGVVYGMSEDEYHGQGAFKGMFKDELSSTGAKLLLELPAKFKYQHLDGHSEHKAAFDLGSALHAKVLGAGSPVEVIKHDSYRTSAAKEARDKAYAAGKVPMLEKDMAQINGMAESVLAHPLAKKLHERAGHPEVSMFAEHNGVKLRCRFDYLPDEGGIAVDLKTTGGSASPAGFQKSAADFKYHVQRAHYLDILNRVTGRDAEMLFVVVETSPPYAVNVHQLDQQFAGMGETEALEARDIFKRCRETDEWPAYPVKINLLQAPMFAVYQHQERFGENA